MSVIQTIGYVAPQKCFVRPSDIDAGLRRRNQVVGPTLFGIVYIKTVATFPEAIFYVIIAVVSLSLFFLFFVQIPPDRGVIDAESDVLADADVAAIPMDSE